MSFLDDLRACMEQTEEDIAVSQAFDGLTGAANLRSVTAYCELRQYERAMDAVKKDNECILAILSNAAAGRQALAEIVQAYRRQDMTQRESLEMLQRNRDAMERCFRRHSYDPDLTAPRYAPHTTGRALIENAKRMLGGRSEK